MNFDSLRDQVTNLSLYDLKAGVRKVQNAVMNYTEMESKVREATNNEPWGASSSLMQEIANGTFNYQTLNEIMPMIYKRFTEKAAEEWRQIYKALQLLEFLIKHGSERVIDDVRSHLSLLKMLRQFNFIDANGKDQGLNVRNRSKELTDLLSDVDRIRQERKKARASKGKYGGVEGGGGLGNTLGSSSRYGGYGSESAGANASFGGYTGGVYGDGGGFGGNTAEDYDAGSQSRTRAAERFDEYDEYDEGSAAPSSRRKAESSRTTTTINKNKAQPPPPPKAKAPEVDLFSFDDPEPVAAPVSTSNGKAPAADFGGFQAGGADDDDFDDFQSATPAPAPTKPAAMPSLGAILPPTSAPNYNTQFAQPTPQQAPVNKAQDFSGIFATTSPSASTTSTPAPTMNNRIMSPSAPKPTGYQAAQPNYYTSVSNPAAQSAATANAGIKSPASSIGSTAQPKRAAGGDAFASLLSGSNLKSKTTGQGSGMSMQEMAKQKASAGLWGTSSSPAPSGGYSSPAPQQTKQGGGGGGALDDLLG